jgi:hypothetical protein
MGTVWAKALRLRCCRDPRKTDQPARLGGTGLRYWRIGHPHAEVNGGGGSQTHIRVVPFLPLGTTPRRPQLPPKLGSFPLAHSRLAGFLRWVFSEPSHPSSCAKANRRSDENETSAPFWDCNPVTGGGPNEVLNRGHWPHRPDPRHRHRRRRGAGSRIRSLTGGVSDARKDDGSAPRQSQGDHSGTGKATFRTPAGPDASVSRSNGADLSPRPSRYRLSLLARLMRRPSALARSPSIFGRQRGRSHAPLSWLRLP